LTAAGTRAAAGAYTPAALTPLVARVPDVVAVLVFELLELPQAARPMIATETAASREAERTLLFNKGVDLLDRGTGPPQNM
jgi:hypothetical protein